MMKMPAAVAVKIGMMIHKEWESEDLLILPGRCQ
jgi:hypothetical protein